jgi:hypothetical protein
MNLTKGLLVGAILLSSAAIFVWQRGRVEEWAAEIAGLRLRLDQAAQEAEQFRSTHDAVSAEVTRREQQQTLLEQEAQSKPLARAPEPAKGNPTLRSAVRPAEYYWSDASATAWVPKEHLAQLDFRALSLNTNQEWRITDQAATALGLTETEWAALNRALAEATQRYQDMARARFSQVTWPTPEEESRGLWRAQFRVSAFRAKTLALRKQFADSIQEILEGEKAARLLDFMGRRTESPFVPFGEKEMTILFESTRTPDNQWALQITETGVNNSRPVNCGRTTTRRLDVTNLPPYWRPLIPLPPLETSATETPK